MSIEVLYNLFFHLLLQNFLKFTQNLNLDFFFHKIYKKIVYGIFYTSKTDYH